MAQDTFNTLLSATTIEDTDEFIIKPLGSPEKKATITTLKTNLDGRYQQFGKVIWENASGSQDISGLTFTEGKTYKFRTSDRRLLFIKMTSTLTASLKFPLYAIEDDAYSFGVININGIGGTVKCYHYKLDGNNTTTNYCYVYEIIDMGVAQ